MHTYRTAILVVAAAFALGLAGPAAAKSPVPGKPGGQNIVEIALAVNQSDDEFNYLLGAVGCLTDDQGSNPVVELLTGSDNYTLFAPTDEAFENLQRALGVQEEDLAPDVTCTLGNSVVADVLAYHLTEGRRFSNSVFNRNNMKMIEMVNGQYVISNPDTTLNDNEGQIIEVVPPLININASNGVIHVVDAVLLP